MKSEALSSLPQTRFLFAKSQAVHVCVCVCVCVCESCAAVTQTCRLSPPGANVSGLIPGFNTTILNRLPSSMLLIEVESVLMGFAFLAMVIVRAKRKRFGQSKRSRCFITRL